MDIIVTMPGMRSTIAEYKGFKIKTAQPVIGGGDGSAPAPFDLFLASIATCGATYVAYFCDQRKIPTGNIRVVQRMERNPESKMISKITIDIELPPGFPEKYKKALIHSVDLCAVKKLILDPPRFEIRTVPAA